MLLVHRRLGPKSDIVKTARIIHCAQRTFAHYLKFPTLENWDVEPVLGMLVSLFFVQFSHVVGTTEARTKRGRAMLHILVADY